MTKRQRQVAIEIRAAEISGLSGMSRHGPYIRLISLTKLTDSELSGWMHGWKNTYPTNDDGALAGWLAYQIASTPE